MKKFFQFNFLFSILLLLSAIQFNSSAQVKLNYYIPGDIKYNSRIPTPESYLGFVPGEYHVTYDQVIGYIKLLANSSGRILIEQYGKTYEQRPLYLITISSQQNLKNIDKIKTQHKFLSDPAKSSSLKTENMPIVTWLGFSVHGNEASGTNAVPLLLYYLTASEGSEINNLLSNTIILIDPTINPDGYSRFAEWVNMNRGNVLNPDPDSREHTEYWPGGRGNHYWFDPNRDWLATQHPEGKGRIKKFHEWMPNVLTDHHEMGRNSTFFFQPGVPARTNPITPAENFKLTAKIGNYHALALNKIKSLYFSQENYDDYYYGKGSTYPDINGSIGILFEQASVRGHLTESAHGLMAFPFAIRNHLTAALSSLKASAEMRVELLNYQKNFFINEMKNAEKSDIKAYVFGYKNNDVLNSYFVSLLRNNEIDIYALNKRTIVNNINFEPGSAYVVPTHQPNYALIRAIFEKNNQFKDSVFYDISTWTMPLAFNIPYAEYKAANQAGDLIGEEITDLKPATGIFEESENPYAYIFSWNRYLVPKALYKILTAGIKAEVAKKPFTIVTSNGVKNFTYGTIIIPAGIQSLDITTVNKVLKEAVEENNIDIYSLQTGLAETGIDIGSLSIEMLELPKVMMITGPGVSSYNAGEIWQLLDWKMNMPLSLVEMHNLQRVNLDKYTTIVFAGGSYSSIDSNTINSLKEWVRKGGTILSIGNSTEWLAKNKFTDVKYVTNAELIKDTSSERRSYANKEIDRASSDLPGAILEANIDVTNPIGYGYTNAALFMFVSGDIVLKPSKDPYSTPLAYGKNPVVSGFVPARAMNYFRNSASIVTDRLGRGNIIMMAETPNYRAFWYGTNKLFMNSIFFSKILN